MLPPDGQPPSTEQRPDSRRLLSICVPTLNEESNVSVLYRRVCQVMEPLQARYRFEIIFTDNHSSDRTFEEIARLALGDPRVRAVRFSRNFGFQRSILANFCEARGDAAIQLDCDMQDPPELIPTFLSYWEDGYKVVYGIRRERPQEAKALFVARKMFYRLIDMLSEDELPRDAGDFRLVDRCILDELRRVRDQFPYLRGMIAAMGFRQIGIPYDREERARGASKFNLLRLVSLALDGVLHHSIIPLRIATLLGAVISALAVVGFLYYLILRVFLPTDWPAGFASTTLLILFSIGVNALFLGIIGEYIGRIFKNVKSAPLVIVEAVIDSRPDASVERAARGGAGSVGAAETPTPTATPSWRSLGSDTSEAEERDR
jgi:polyisoprenyl-phosphate glycosyltransferase